MAMTVAQIIEAFAVSLTVRAIIGLWGYSGAGREPMYGDFEAQRHWMEITTALPIGEWYKHTERNDLQYWGLDYPPLTAYVSYLFGKLAFIFHIPELVKFESSRGHESEYGKAYMRGTVLLADLMVLLPSIYLLTTLLRSKQRRTVKVSCNTQMAEYLAMSLTMLNPGLLLIDHGHFQYNGVCIGLTILAVYAILEEKLFLGSALFCLSLNFKQMALYYSPVFFFCLLRKCLEQPKVGQQFNLFIKIGFTVIASFALMWFPFCIFHHEEETCFSSLLQVLQRQFPFARGIFEDKVANIWYSLSVVIDFRQVMSREALVKSCLTLTLILLAPTASYLLTHKLTGKGFILALSNSSLAFFLASYQVHEKSILLMLVPTSFLFVEHPLFISWLQVLGCFSMFPLLSKDELVLPYWVCLIGFVILVDNYIRLVPSSIALKPNFQTKSSSIYLLELIDNYHILQVLIYLSVAGMIILHIAERTINPPSKLPHIYPALISIYSAINLCVAYLYLTLWMWSESIESKDIEDASSEVKLKKEN